MLPAISPGVGILLLCCVFFFQTFVDMIKTPHWYWCQNNNCTRARAERNGYNPLSQNHQQRSKMEYFVCFVQAILENRVMKVIALLLQTIGIFGFIAVWVASTNASEYDMTRPMVGYPLVILVLSFTWSNWFQEKIAEPDKKDLRREDTTARFKSSKYTGHSFS